MSRFVFIVCNHADYCHIFQRKRRPRMITTTILIIWCTIVRHLLFPPPLSLSLSSSISLSLSPFCPPSYFTPPDSISCALVPLFHSRCAPEHVYQPCAFWHTRTHVCIRVCSLHFTLVYAYMHSSILEQLRDLFSGVRSCAHATSMPSFSSDLWSSSVMRHLLSTGYVQAAFERFEQSKISKCRLLVGMTCKSLGRAF